MSAIGLHIGELQRVTSQLEEEVAEARHYTSEDRQALGSALTDLACRLELARIAVLEREPVEANPR